MQLIKMIVQGKGQKGEKTAGIEVPDAVQVLDISYGRIIDYEAEIIKMKRTE
jgi:hypothetical protein